MSFKATSFIFVLAAFAILAPVKSAPTFLARHEGHDDDATAPAVPDFVKQNGLDAQKLNAQFKTIKETDSCEDGQMACVTSKFAQCVGGKWELTPCAATLSCYALPLVNKAGTSLVCDTQEDTLRRFEAAGVTGGSTGADTTTTPNAPTSDDGADDDCDDDDTGAQDQDGDNDDCDGDSTDATTIPAATGKNTPITVKSAIPTPASSSSIAISSTTGAPAIGNQAKAPTETTITIQAATTTVASEDLVFTTITLDRRQILSITSSSASTVITPVVTPVVTATSVTATTTSTGSIVTPTVVIGTDGIVTVTLVSTVTVSATDCAVTGTGSSVPVTLAPAPVTVTSAVPTPSASASTSISSIGTEIASSSSIAQTSSSAIIVLTAAPIPTPTTTSISAKTSAFTIGFR